MNSEIKAINSIKGPILIFGAGGFIGFNLFIALLKYRLDVYGVFRDPESNWRLISYGISKKNIIKGNINSDSELRNIFKKIKPKTIFNLAAYGAYSTQDNFDLIYDTNLISNLRMLEILKEYKFSAFIYAGSQSEYGLNSNSPSEKDELIPNSHYAISKVASSYAIKYYGKKLNLPVMCLRIYSAYGPWEEPTRLVPTLIKYAKNNKFPKLVDPEISRDFIYIDDVVNAFIISASKINKNLYGEVFNIATSKKTTIRDITLVVKDLFNISNDPVFGKMKNRKWDMNEWYGNNRKAKSILKWKPNVSLKNGLVKTANWQNEIKN